MQQTLEFIENYAIWGYGILFLYSFGGGMIALLAASVLAGVGKLDLSLCIIIAAVANFLGDELLFYLAKFNKNAVLPYFKKHRRKLALAQILFKSYGGKIILAKKFIYGLKTLIPLAIGLSKYSAKKFLFLNAICAIIWAVSLGLLGFFAGDFIQQISEKYGQNTSFLIIFLVAILFALWLYFEKQTKRTKI
ncbi:DedA family membrane protein, type III (SNARE domain) [Candidatus Campylobacter infans]|uniref:DedA family membrane protein, type III (SNARE domain) n=1 Tax=Candidatus Campylobacter infans TaxID=2561898 RepID=A0A7H9CLG6_9BACT|nr:DedA family protein [Candidatus Campylobacter infans]QLI05094.1 DedA family membrane protein, type III (SNARE domain) [Candidatus Campylobacter infans]